MGLFVEGSTANTDITIGVNMIMQPHGLIVLLSPLGSVR